MRPKSHVMCHMSYVLCQMSHVTCHLPPVTNAKIYNNIPSPANSPIIKSKGRSRSQNFKPVTVTHHETMEIVWLQAKGWGHKIDDGVVAAKTRKKVAELWDFACQACWVRAPTRKDWISKTIFFLIFKKIPPLPFPSSFQKCPPSPFGPMSERKLSLFLMAALKILAGDKVFHELKESLMVLDLSYLSQRDKMRLLCIALKA